MPFLLRGVLLLNGNAKTKPLMAKNKKTPIVPRLMRNANGSFFIGIEKSIGECLMMRSLRCCIATRKIATNRKPSISARYFAPAAMGRCRRFRKFFRMVISLYCIYLYHKIGMTVFIESDIFGFW